MQKKSWIELVPDIFKTWLTTLKYSKGVENVLVVEGKTDYVFYMNWLNETVLYEDGKKIKLNIKKKSILFDFCTSEELFIKSEPYKYRDLKKQFNEADDRNDYMAFRFVVECIRHYENNANAYKSIDCYGIIDKDFGHDDLLVNLKNISESQFRDRETTMARCYFPLLLNGCNKRGEATKLLSMIVDPLIKQGILEKSSHKLATSENILASKSLTHHQFCDDLKNGKVTIDYNFDTYLKNNYNSLCDEIVEDYKKRVLKEYTFNNNLQELIERWINNNDDEVDKKRIDRIFAYCNGHYLLQQMIRWGDSVFGFQSEEEFSKNVTLLKRNDLFFDSNPLKQYKEYRLAKKLYTIMS